MIKCIIMTHSTYIFYLNDFTLFWVPLCRLLAHLTRRVRWAIATTGHPSSAFCILINSSIKPLNQFEPNFGGMVLGWSSFRILPTIPPPTKMAAITKNRKFVKKSIKNYLLWNCWANWAQTMVEWSSDGPLWELCLTTPAANQDSRRY